eukprot:scaffold286_cov52-Attheya_sp.AAC.5
MSDDCVSQRHPFMHLEKLVDTGIVSGLWCWVTRGLVTKQIVRTRAVGPLFVMMTGGDFSDCQCIR